MISIVIPAYNEEKSVKNVIGNIREVLAGAGISGYEIIVVDDGSTDSTYDTALGCGVKVARNLNNIGYGFSLKHGIREAANDTILIMDCDETYPPETIPPLIQKYQEGFHLVVGQRTGTDYNPTLTKTILRLILSSLIYYTSGKKSLA